MSDSVKGSTTSLAASAIAAFKHYKQELSGFPGLKHNFVVLTPIILY